MSEKYLRPHEFAALSDVDLEAIRLNPEAFVTTTAQVYTIQEWETLEEREQARLVRDKQPTQEWSETIPMSVRWDSGRMIPSLHHFKIGEYGILLILRHGDGEGTWGIYRHVHEPAIHCAMSFYEATEWCRQYARNLLENLGSLLWVCEFARHAEPSKYHSPYRPLRDHAYELLAKIAGRCHLDAEAIRLAQRLRDYEAQAIQEFEDREAQEKPKRGLLQRVFG